MAKESPDDLYEDDKWDFNDDGFGGMDNFGMEDERSGRPNILVKYGETYV